MLRNPVLIFQALRVDPKIHLLGLSTLGIRKAVLFFCGTAYQKRVLAGGGLRFRIFGLGFKVLSSPAPNPRVDLLSTTASTVGEPVVGLSQVPPTHNHIVERRTRVRTHNASLDFNPSHCNRHVGSTAIRVCHLRCQYRPTHASSVQACEGLAWGLRNGG